MIEIAENPMTPEAALDLVGLTERLDHFPAQLSRGQQQRVAITRAISKNPEVLHCDEPTGALDSKTGIVVLEALERINRELGTATAIITHNADIADMAAPATVYRPRNPQTTDYYRCVEDYLESFIQVYGERFERSYGFFRPYFQKVIYRYLGCGDFYNGSARVNVTAATMNSSWHFPINTATFN